MTYRYLPPGKRSFFEYRPVRQAQSPATPKSPENWEFTPTGDSCGGDAAAAATQSDDANEFATGDATWPPAASSQPAETGGDCGATLPATESATATTWPETSCAVAVDVGTAPADAPSVASVATAELAATHPARRPLSEEDVARALVYIECGYSLRAAAAEIGRHHSTLIKSLNSDRGLSDALAAAREKARSAPLAQVREASKTSWRAAAWLVKYLDAREHGGVPRRDRPRRS